ncbi:universal stress protein [Amycolatopsis sp. K13G38]|uniref:Universal stress protein n=1 Tax=Amycolatopsis acididurans TaxID=2724524 RepID=A0ABX1J1B8_9PSEU|nr:universal stress protein [Amycolatopsis acididurans]NKQ52051.1 universal stress protein [Amycolatopsis acididurans]
MTSKGAIVVGVDGSPVSAAALRWAVAEAKATGRAVEAVTAWTYTPALDPGAPESTVTEIAAAHRRALDELIDSVPHDEVTIRTQVVEGDAREVVLAAANDASLLVLGSHGHGLLMHALVGSVSAHCLRHATCPVVIVPAQVINEHASATAGYTPGPIL